MGFPNRIHDQVKFLVLKTLIFMIHLLDSNTCLSIRLILHLWENSFVSIKFINSFEYFKCFYYLFSIENKREKKVVILPLKRVENNLFVCVFIFECKTFWCRPHGYQHYNAIFFLFVSPQFILSLNSVFSGFVYIRLKRARLNFQRMNELTRLIVHLTHELHTSLAGCSLFPSAAHLLSIFFFSFYRFILCYFFIWNLRNVILRKVFLFSSSSFTSIDHNIDENIKTKKKIYINCMMRKQWNAFHIFFHHYSGLKWQQ